MHGIIFAELQKYVTARLGEEAWKALLTEAAVPTSAYLANREYPDAEMVTLVATASRMTGRPQQALLEDFGEFIAPDLMRMFHVLIERPWRTLDVIEHTEGVIHAAVRIKNPGARPPELKCRRASADEVVITYTSARRLCAVAKGIARGVAAHYGDQIVIREERCMLEGHPSCEIAIRVVAGLSPSIRPTRTA